METQLCPPQPIQLSSGFKGPGPWTSHSYDCPRGEPPKAVLREPPPCPEGAPEACFLPGTWPGAAPGTGRAFGDIDGTNQGISLTLK